MSAPAGWYPDPTTPGTQRYWDGEAWSDKHAPLASGLTPSGLAVVIAVGILIAVAVVWFVFRGAHANDGLKCETENAQRAMDGQPTIDCGD